MNCILCATHKKEDPDSPWENGYVESVIGKMRDELLDCEIFDTMFEAKVLIERWAVDNIYSKMANILIYGLDY